MFGRGLGTQEAKIEAVVVPLREEVDNLRLQLDEVRGRLQRIEQTSTEPPINLDTPLPSGKFTGKVSTTSTGGGKLQQQLELERSDRHELEMHAKTIQQQNAVYCKRK